LLLFCLFKISDYGKIDLRSLIQDYLPTFKEHEFSRETAQNSIHMIRQSRFH